MKPFFKKARPVWGQGKERVMNVTVGFTCTFAKYEKVIIRVAASSIYRVFINGKFLIHGPARASKDYYRVDELLIPADMLEEKNVAAIEVVNFYVNSFYTLKQPAFLQAEICYGEDVIAYTGVGGSFQAIELFDRIQKVQRYSFQRPFIEVYRLKEGYDLWRCKSGRSSLGLVETEEKNLLERHVPLQEYPLSIAKKAIAKGGFTYKKLDEPIWKDRSHMEIGPKLLGFANDELERKVSVQLDGCETIRFYDKPDTYTELEPQEFSIWDMGRNQTGFLGIHVKCHEDSHLVLVFDEAMLDGDVSYNRQLHVDCVNAISLELKKGEYDIETIQPYTCRYFKPMLFAGKVSIEQLYIREFKNAQAQSGEFECSDSALNLIFEAGRETFAQNATDIYMDCPSRERAGWLCDSFFTSRVEMDLTGNHLVEDNFLENYVLPEEFPDIPKGMVPMCYPADHYDGLFIANWALWLILELYEYRDRSRNMQLIKKFKEKVTGILNFLEQYENEYGLLEDVPGWRFVEWSKANDFTENVNFPTNMLYSAALRAAGHLYGKEAWKEKGEKIRNTVNEMAYDGMWFCDQALRLDGKLVIQPHRTEVCQYYACFFRIIDEQQNPEFYHRILDEFGSEQCRREKYPQIWPANAFIGNYLRLEILSGAKRAQQILDETREHFYYMAVKSGTLWEHTGDYASCNHGFASHIVHCFYRDILGVSSLKENHITIYIQDVQLEYCKGKLPLRGGTLEIAWNRSGKNVKIEVSVPKGYEVEIHSDLSLEVVGLC